MSTWLYWWSLIYYTQGLGITSRKWGDPQLKLHHVCGKSTSTNKHIDKWIKKKDIVCLPLRSSQINGKHVYIVQWDSCLDLNTIKLGNVLFTSMKSIVRNLKVGTGLTVVDRALGWRYCTLRFKLFGGCKTQLLLTRTC